MLNLVYTIRYTRTYTASVTRTQRLRLGLNSLGTHVRAHVTRTHRLRRTEHRSKSAGLGYGVQLRGVHAWQAHCSGSHWLGPRALSKSTARCTLISKHRAVKPSSSSHFTMLWGDICRLEVQREDSLPRWFQCRRNRLLLESTRHLPILSSRPRPIRRRRR